MSFELLCMALIAMVFGLLVTFGGYRLFLVLLPIWGFFAGFFLGAQTIQVLFSSAFLGTVTGWIVGFFVGLIFAVLSYLFYFLAVAILSFSLGYGAVAAIAGGSMGILVWLIAVVVGVIIALVVIRFNIQKYAIIAITAIGGTAMIVFTILAAFGGATVDDLVSNPVSTAVQSSWLWALFFIGVAILGFVFQIRANRSWEVETYNRYAEM